MQTAESALLRCVCLRACAFAQFECDPRRGPYVDQAVRLPTIRSQAFNDCGETRIR